MLLILLEGGLKKELKVNIPDNVEELLSRSNGQSIPGLDGLLTLPIESLIYLGGGSMVYSDELIRQDAPASKIRDELRIVKKYTVALRHRIKDFTKFINDSSFHPKITEEFALENLLGIAVTFYKRKNKERWQK